jgi:hypothetical protein
MKLQGGYTDITVAKCFDGTFFFSVHSLDRQLELTLYGKPEFKK